MGKKEGAGFAGDFEGERLMIEELRHRPTWIGALLREMAGMPKKHVVVFLVTTVTLIVLEVEFTEGWHLIHILELTGVMGFFFLLWAAWRAGRTHRL